MEELDKKEHNPYFRCSRCKSEDAPYVTWREFWFNKKIRHGNRLCKKCQVVIKIKWPFGRILYIFSKHNHLKRIGKILSNYQYYWAPCYNINLTCEISQTFSTAPGVLSPIDVKVEKDGDAYCVRSDKYDNYCGYAKTKDNAVISFIKAFNHSKNEELGKHYFNIVE